MVRVTEELALSQDEVTFYYTHDPYLGNLPVFAFHGPSTTTNSTLNSSRIQLHIFTAGGFQSYPRITVSPNSPFYQSVNYLPREKQGDETCRGLAFGLLKYFKELPEPVKSSLLLQCGSSRRRPGSAPALFLEQHAADLAGSMVKVENIQEVVQDLEAALRSQHINHIDVDLVLPPGSIAPFQELDPDQVEDEDLLLDPSLKQYGSYAPLVKLFGETTFLPTAKLRRAPSRPTSINRTKSFMKNQKMSLRREMGELVDTEERYVIKMHELVNHIADDFRDKAKNRAFGSFSPSAEDLERLFPKSLDRILQINSAFLADVRKVMDETEEDAMLDLEAQIGSTGSRYGGTGRLKDPTGALAFAKILLEWFPKFAECYQEYIRASQEFPQIISSFLKTQSSFSHRVQQSGEQRLRSAVIEPVQRLPRYSLFIDNIVNYLPVLHPALKPMLEARDIITSICSMDPPETDKSQVVNRLKNLVESWPKTFHPTGRLITAVDFIELPAPFRSVASTDPRPELFLLFTDRIVILRKARESNISARGLMAEIDRPSASAMMANMTAAAGGQKKTYDFVFSGWHVLSETRFTMSEDGRTVSMLSFHDLKDGGSGVEATLQTPTVRVFLLHGAYDGKALKFTEEIAKTRVEGRFSEAERETDKWSLRTIRLPGAEITLHTAVFEEGIDSLVNGRQDPAPIRIVIDHARGTKGAPLGHYGVDIVANITTLPGGFKYRLEVDGLNGRVFVDELVTEHCLPALVKRVTDLLRTQYHLSNTALTVPFTSFNCKTLKSIQVHAEVDKKGGFRPASPVKMLSNLFSSGFNNSTTSFNTSTSTGSLGKNSRGLVNVPSMPPMTRSNSNKSTHSTFEVEARNSVRAAHNGVPENPIFKLEQTCAGYVAALKSRKGNVVGKILRSRGAADELAINAIYNTFIENPFDQRAADEYSVDVLFVAFEKYLRMAWKDQMGEVISNQTLDELQSQAFRLHPGDFTDYVRNHIAEMSPQNRRAFIAIIKLLADLLDGCGNDGDRGALTAAFAELLVQQGNPHNYINLLDRMVMEHERLFEDIGPGAISGSGNNSAFGSISNRANASATGSITSNNSSFRKRFADTILRQNSTSDRPSVWRTLSKTTRNVATGDPVTSSSLSKATSINRSRSIESPGRRPMSRDRPTVLGAFDERPSSSAGPVACLETIGEPTPAEEEKAEKSAKKKRRSSLSDLKSLLAAASLGGSATNSPASPDRRGLTLKLNGSPRTPSPTKIPMAEGSGIMDRSRAAMYRTGSPNQKENTPLNTTPLRNIGNLTERPQNIMGESPPRATPDVVVIKDLWSIPSHKKSASVTMSSNIPTLRGRAPSSSRPTTSPSRSPQKLRLQSPQKLRERLQNEHKAINEAEASLHTELSKIGAEMARLSSSPSHTSVAALQSSLSSLECRIPVLISDLNTRNEAIKSEVEKSLQASEYKVKGLDQLFKETTAENELLYEKFNGELGKIVKALKGKEKAELVEKLREQSEETAKAKKENARLRREVLTLRALLKGNE